MCHNRTRCVPREIVSLPRRLPRGATPVWLAAVLAVLLLVATGFAYRTAMARVQGEDVEPVRLPVPLAQFPWQVGDWAGENLPIPETTEVYMRQNFADDYLSRHYTNGAQKLSANLYVVYCSSKPGGILGHRPGICFPNNGWVHDSTETSEITSRSGRPIGCLIHRFHKRAPAYQEIVVLSFYVLNGQITLDESGFSGFWTRRPNISGDLARYVAQVQVSSLFEHSVRTAAAQMADAILSFLPDRNGIQNVTSASARP
jgi:hypothetical protein